MHSLTHSPLLDKKGCLTRRLPWFLEMAQGAEEGCGPPAFSSVGKGCEDEKAVFFFADPAHQLMNGIDSGRLGPQWAVAHVELKSTCHLEGGTGGSSRLDTCTWVLPSP